MQIEETDLFKPNVSPYNWEGFSYHCYTIIYCCQREDRIEKCFKDSIERIFDICKTSNSLYVTKMSTQGCAAGTCSEPWICSYCTIGYIPLIAGGDLRVGYVGNISPDIQKENWSGIEKHILFLKKPEKSIKHRSLKYLSQTLWILSLESKSLIKSVINHSLEIIILLWS